MRKLTIEEMHQLAKARGGRCLVDTYVDSRTKLLWQCVDGHEWEARPYNIKLGKWCPECAKKKRVEGRKLGIEEMRGIAKERAGKCLTDIYVNNRTKLLWECAEGHQWEARPTSVKRGSGVPTVPVTFNQQSNKFISLRNPAVANVFLLDTSVLTPSFCGNAHLGISGRPELIMSRKAPGVPNVHRG